jgi:uncharacterized protein (TIGR03067 family)
VLAAIVVFPLATASAAPVALVERTVQAAIAFAASTAMTTAPALLAKAVLASLRRGRWALATTVMVILAVLGGTGYLLMRSGISAAAVDSRTDREKLQGAWSITSMSTDGVDAASKDLPSEVLVFQGDRVNMPIDSDYSLDTKANPKRIDMTCRITAPPNNWMLGIFEVSGDDLKLCLGAPGHERPTEFVTAPGNWRTLMNLKRRPPGR